MSELSTAVLVGTLEEYQMHAPYLTSVSSNIVFIPTNLEDGLTRKYFESMKNGTFVVSPYLYDPSKSSTDKGTTKQDNQHSFISKLNQNYEFNIDMKFVENSLKINQGLNQFRTKFNQECADKSFGNCTDLKPLLSNGNTRKGKSDNTVEEFINAFQVENVETSIDGVYVYRVFRSEEDTQENTAQATAQQSTVEDTPEGIEDAKKKLLLEINNTNWENMGKRDLILSSIHIVTSEAYDNDMLNFERNDENLELGKDDNYQKTDLRVRLLNESDANINGTAESENGWAEGDLNREHTNQTQEDNFDFNSENRTESMNDNFELNNSRKLVGQNERNKTEQNGTNENIVINNDPLKINETSEMRTTEDITDTTHLITDGKNQPQVKPDGPLKTNNQATNDSGEEWSRSRPVRSVSKSNDNKILIESIGKYSYVNNTWLIVLNEDDTLREGNEQFLCRIISTDINDNETMLGQGQDCSKCFNFREIYEIIELNKKEFEESKKRIVEIVFKLQLKTDSFTVVILSLSAMGVIACIVILGFIIYRIIQRDVLEGNPTITIMLLLSIIYNYAVITPFVVTIDPTVEYVDYYSHLLCYIRLISIITSFNFIFSLLLTRCLMLSFCDHDGALMSHINGYIQSSFCFFITIIQILFLINLFLIKFIFDVDIKCDIIQGNYIYMLGYNIILLLLLSFTIPFIYKCRRNYYEGIYLTITIISIVLAWCVWIYLYIESDHNECMLILGIFLTSTLILMIIFIPRTYHMIINIVRDNITSILPALSSQYGMSGNNIHNIHYRSTQALYDIVNDTENKHLGEVNPYYVSRNETKRIYQTNQQPAHQERYYRANPNREEQDEQTSLYDEDITGRLQSSLGLHNVRSPARSQRQSPSFHNKNRVRSPSLASRAASPPQLDDVYEPSCYETTSRCETTRFDTPSTMTRF
ncbi:hypothetical protein WDU94_000890 [Cyamophila willieti]